MAARQLARSQAERMWMVGGALLALLVVVIGYFFVISPQRDETADLQSQAADATSQNLLLQSKINSLRSDSANIARFQKELTIARQALPATSGLSDFLRSLQSLGNETLTTVNSIDVGTPIDVTPVADGQPTAAPSAAPTGNAAAVAAAPAAPPAAGTTAKPGGVYSLPITAKVTGSAGALSGFLQQLQAVQPRAVLITAITEAADSTSTKGDAQSLQLTMSAFVAPATKGATPAPTAGR